jgi:hypothetical protein
MKKVFLAFAVVAAFVACNGEASTSTEGSTVVDSTVKAIDTTVKAIDSTVKATDSTVKAIDSTVKGK